MSRTATDTPVAASPYTASFSASVSMTRGNGIPRPRARVHERDRPGQGGVDLRSPSVSALVEQLPPPVVHPDRERGAEGRRRQRQQEEEFGEPELREPGHAGDEPERRGERPTEGRLAHVEHREEPGRGVHADDAAGDAEDARVQERLGGVRPVGARDVSGAHQVALALAPRPSSPT